MRDPKRISRTIALLHEIWLLVPDWRLGQVLANADRSIEQKLFNYEDSDIELKLTELLEKLHGDWVNMTHPQ